MPSGPSRSVLVSCRVGPWRGSDVVGPSAGEATLSPAVAHDQAVIRLAQYRPFDRDGLDGRAALTDLVVAAALERDGQLPSLRECREICNTFWGLEVETDELRDVLDDLVKAGRMVQSNGHYAVSEAAGAELAERLRAAKEIEQRALDEWEATLRTLNAGLTFDEVAELRDDLHTWLERVMRRHGVESALILYPEEPRAQRVFAELEKDGLDFLPRRDGRVERLREQALYLFVRQPTEAQRMFLSSLLNTAYFLTVFTLDPSAGRLVQDVTRGQRVYLDTNFVYRILNLQGPRLHLSAKRLLEMTQALGYETAVTPWTVAELKHSLERARRFLMSKPIPPAELAEIAASATTDENFVTAYWRRLKEKPVSVKDFFDFYSQIETHLGDYQIGVAEEGCLAVDRSDDAINEQLGIIEQALGPYDRPDPVKQHDVKHRLLVQRLRGAGNRRFSNAGYWFLTADSLLPRYDRAASHESGEPPFCASVSAWFQVIRSFTPRTGDFDQTLADLLASPYIRYRGRISYQSVQEVVARIDLYEGATSELATKVLLDTALMREVAETPEEADRETKIHNAIVAAAAEQERRLAETQERETQERDARRELETITLGLEEKLAAEKERATAAAQQRDEERRQHDEERRQREESEKRAQAEAAESDREHDESVKVLAGQVAAQKEQLEALQAQQQRAKRARRGALAAALPLVAVTVVTLSLVFDVVSGAWPVTLLVLGGVGLACGGLGVVLGHKRVWAALAALGVILGVAVELHGILADGDEPSQPPTSEAPSE